MNQLRWQEHRALLLGLTATAGWIDALAWLSLGKVFVSFMSGNLLFLGIGAGDGNGEILARAAVALGTFLLATGAGAVLTGSHLTPDAARSPMVRTLSIEAVLLGAFAVLWLAAGNPADHATASYALLAIGSAAMGLQAAVSLAFHLPNVATVAMTGTLAQIAAVIGWRAREGRSIVAETPAVSIMVPLCLAYLIAAFIVAVAPRDAAFAFGPVLLLIAGVALDARQRARTATAPPGRPVQHVPRTQSTS